MGHFQTIDEEKAREAQVERMRRVCYIENASRKTAMDDDDDVNNLFL